MTRTFFNVPDSLHSFIVSRGTRGEDGNQELTESFSRKPKYKTSFSGGGGLFSTPEDFSKLLLCLLNYGGYEDFKLLKKETILEMNKNQIGNLVLDIKENYYKPSFCCNFRGLIKNTSKWGLAYMIDNETRHYGRKAGTVLWGGVYNTYFFIDFESGIAASVYTQHLPFNHPATTLLFDRFSEIIYSKK